MVSLRSAANQSKENGFFEPFLHLAVQQQPSATESAESPRDEAQALFGLLCAVPMSLLLWGAIAAMLVR